MKQIDAANAGLLVVALACAVAAMARPSALRPATATGTLTSSALETPIEQSDRGPSLRDATGALIPLGHYQRIVSASTIADALLLELAEPGRVAAYTDFSAVKEWDAHRFRDKPSLTGLNRLEPILALKPDLLLISAIDDRSKATRLREAGLNVFDLGPMEGFSTLKRTIARVGLLIGVPERAERYAALLTRRLQAIARHLAPSEHRRAMYLSVYGLQLYGGAANTSFHDVLTFAGLNDVAAEQYKGWPLFSPEQVLGLRPDIVVTNVGMAQTLCQNPGLDRLPACRDPSGIVALPEWLLGDPGPNMLVAAELLHEAVYGPRN